jgi:hypothetical protein
MISTRFAVAIAAFLTGCAQPPANPAVGQSQPLDLASKVTTVEPVVIPAPPAATAPNIYAYCGYANAWPGAFQCNDTGIGFGGM